MNYSSIIDHLKSCGYQVSVTEFCLIPMISVECSIAGHDITLLHLKIEELTGMPSFFLKHPNKYGRIAHTLEDKTFNVASICVNVPDSVSINFEVPELVFEESLKRHISLLENCLSDPKWNEDELLREFLAGWNHIQDQKYEDFLCLSDKGEFELLNILPPQKDIKYGLNSCHFGIPQEFEQKPEFSVINDHIINRGKPNGHGCIVPLQKLIPAPWQSADLKDWYLQILNFISPDVFDSLNRTLGQTRAHSFWLVFNADTPSGITWFGIHFHLKNSIKSKKGLPLNSKHLEFWELKAMNVRLFNKERVMPRSGAIQELQNKKVLLIGCGSVGSQIANQLASTGIGHLTLSDSDSFSLDNLYRHSLPASYISWPKTWGLKSELTKKYPWLNVEFMFSELLSLRYENILNTFDLIIIAIGSPTQERIFHDYCVKNSIETAVLNTWVEGYGIGGHAVIDIPDSKGCLRCAYVDPLDFSRGLASNLNFLKPNQKLTKNLAGCGNAFLPYSNLSALQTALIASSLATKFLMGQLHSSSKVSWKGSDFDVIQAGLHLTDRYSAFSKSLEVLPLLNSGCDLCND
ncbi:ThiF family adenylyltransferase [Acinetobacter baumannii]|nr:ThiF family adenylyltransferase [Acinetobacter baumannii]MDO7406298.1 ThiF family adenylyltransferase [Acinetobacter baumannii]